MPESAHGPREAHLHRGFGGEAPRTAAVRQEKDRYRSSVPKVSGRTTYRPPQCDRHFIGRTYIFRYRRMAIMLDVTPRSAPMAKRMKKNSKKFPAKYSKRFSLGRKI